MDMRQIRVEIDIAIYMGVDLRVEWIYQATASFVFLRARCNNHNEVSPEENQSLGSNVPAAAFKSFISSAAPPNDFCMRAECSCRIAFATVYRCRITTVSQLPLLSVERVVTSQMHKQSYRRITVCMGSERNPLEASRHRGSSSDKGGWDLHLKH